MELFSIVEVPIDPWALRDHTLCTTSGGFVSFEGWVRNHHAGKRVASLEYTAYRELAEKEGAKIMQEAVEQFELTHAICQHRIGHLAIGELAVCVAVSSAHRDAAFSACRFIIDEVKKRVPIWKKEFYLDGEHDWPSCQGCGGH